MDMPAILQQSTTSELELAPSDSNESFNFEHEMSELYQIFYPKATDPRPHPSQIPYSAPLFQNNPPAPVPPPKEPPSDEFCRQLEQRQRLALLQSLQAQHQFQLRRQQHYCGQQQQQQSQRKSGGIRKKKAEQLKTVYRVPAANILNVDKWAWRKYGQKPIKGSPFPRNYYRCSSSKGCTARKQVERSLTEAEVYVVTYTGDHLHPWPLHRNALAGISRPNHRINSRHAAADSQSPSVAEEGLLIPNNKYVDEDMLRGMEELTRQIQHGPGSPV